MTKSLRFLIIDDAPEAIKTHSELIEGAGHEVMVLNSCDDALDVIREYEPDCVLCDLMMPGMNAIEFFKQLRRQGNIKQPTFVIVSGKHFQYDRRKAIDAGIDAYIKKPINQETFVSDLVDIISDNIKLTFWGVRGSMPIPGKKTVKYGGNTNCVTINIANRHHFIFDAGTGIKEYSNYILNNNRVPFNAKIFITHPHYDHINGIPFFVPLYMKGNEFEFFGADQGDLRLKDWLNMQMDSIFFPVTMNEFLSDVKFRSTTEEEFMVGDVQFKTIFLNHPGQCLGYRMTYRDKSICYVTDNELYYDDDIQRYNKDQVNELIEFIYETDVLVIDTTYTDEEYKFKIGWGHSPLSNVVDVANKANVKLLCLYHHDPDQTDVDIDEKLKAAKKMLKDRRSKTKVIAPSEGDEIIL